MTDGKFATSISCMDGRIQDPIDKWIKDHYSVDYVDSITEQGVDKKIATVSDLESIKTKVSISVNIHKSELIVVSGHYDCAANPASYEEHMSQIKKGIKVVSSWNFGVDVIGAWIDENWTVHPIHS